MCAHAGPAELVQARAALQGGEADHALTVLNSFPESAEVHNLRCRVQFTLEHWDAAVSECEKAVSMEGSNSDYHLWLGRALGEKADRASFLSAFNLGKRTRAEFEAAVRLDEHNAEALADLGEFYYSAPGVVGGGVDKAQHVAEQLDKVDPARAYELRGRIAESDKDYAKAEADFKKALTVSRDPAYQWMTLASFYRRRGRDDEMQQAVENGVKIDERARHPGVALYNGASSLIRANRNLDLAAKMLEEYLAGTYMTEEAPAFMVHTRLAKVKAELGDKQGAWKERAAALALAHDYRPALELKL